MEIIKCDNCGKDITKEVKYSQKGFYGWYCKKCYFNEKWEINDRDLKPLKVKYENRS